MDKVIHFGAGSVGRGFLGELYSESGYEVVFIDVKEDVISALNREGLYRLRIVGERTEELTIPNVRAVSAKEPDAVAREVSEAILVSTAVGNNVLGAVAPLIARGIIARKDKGAKAPLNIIICENLMNASKVLYDLVRENSPPEYYSYIDERVGFVEAVIGRMIPIVPPGVAKGDPTLVIAEAYKELPVDRSGFVGQIPKVVGLIPKDNFGAYVERKLFIHNGGHAISAYLGYRKGYEFIYQAVEDGEIHIILRAALDEVGRALIARHKFAPQDISDHIEDLIKRFKNKPLGDTIFRVGRDPIRKLGPNDRLVGGAKTAYQYGIVPDNLSLAVAAALSYDHPDDAEAEKLQEKIEKEGLDRVLEDVCQVEPKSDLGRLIKEKYKSLALRSGRV